MEVLSCDSESDDDFDILIIIIIIIYIYIYTPLVSALFWQQHPYFFVH